MFHLKVTPSYTSCIIYIFLLSIYLIADNISSSLNICVSPFAWRRHDLYVWCQPMALHEVCPTTALLLVTACEIAIDVACKVLCSVYQHPVTALPEIAILH